MNFRQERGLALPHQGSDKGRASSSTVNPPAAPHPHRAAAARIAFHALSTCRTRLFRVPGPMERPDLVGMWHSALSIKRWRLHGEPAISRSEARPRALLQPLGIRFPANFRRSRAAGAGTPRGARTKRPHKSAGTRLGRGPGGLP